MQNKKKDIIDLITALRIFDKFADNKKLAFNNAEDGCYARAHFMCIESLKTFGVNVQKIWVEASQYQILKFKTPNMPRPHGWGYHVAPLFKVRMPDLTVHDLVFDPALFDGPAGIETWKNAMHGSDYAAIKTPCHETKNGYKGRYSIYDRNTSIFTSYNAAHVLKQQSIGQSPIRQVFETATRKQAIDQLNTITKPADAEKDTSYHSSVTIKTSGETWIPIKSEIN
jgi:hypothetical protein